VSLLRAQFHSLRLLLYRGDRILLFGFLAVFVAVLASVISFYAWKLLIGFIFASFVFYVPEQLHAGLLIGLTFGFYALIMVWVASFLWLEVENSFWSDSDKDRLFGRFIPLITAGIMILLVLSGQIVLGWLINNALLPRLLSDPPGGMLFGWLLTALIFLPLMVRLPYLPVLASFENNSQVRPWRLWVASTNGRGLSLGLALIPQLLLIGLLWLIFSRTLGPEIKPIISIILSGFYPDVKTLSLAMTSFLQPSLLPAALLFVLGAGPIIALLATIQVASVRALVGGKASTVSYEVSTRRTDPDQIEDSFPEEAKYEDLYTLSGEGASVEAGEAPDLSDLYTDDGREEQHLGPPSF